MIRTVDPIKLAQAVLLLVPATEQETARIGLIHTSLNRAGDFGESDCLLQALGQIPHLPSEFWAEIKPELARVVSLVYAIYAGDLPDPTNGADRAYIQDVKARMSELTCTALLGDYLFFKK